MAKLSVATYRVLSDEAFTLKASHVKRLEFKLEGSNVFVSESVRRPILWWRIWPRSDNAKYIALINDVAADPNNIPADKIIIEQSTDTKVMRDMHEVIGFSKFIPADTNTIDFRVVIGEVEFSDVILIYQVRAED